MFCMQLQNTMDMEHNMLHSAEQSVTHSTAIKGRQCCNPGMSSASNNGYFPQLPDVHRLGPDCIQVNVYLTETQLKKM